MLNSNWRGLSVLFSSLLLVACDNSNNGTINTDATGATEMVFSPPAVIMESRVAAADLVLEILVDGTPVPISQNDAGQWVGTTMVPSNSSAEVVVNWDESYVDTRLPNNKLPLATATKQLNVAAGATSAELTFLNNEFNTSVDSDNDGRSNLSERNDNYDPLDDDSPGVDVVEVSVRIELELPASLSGASDEVKLAVTPTAMLNGRLVTLTRQGDRWTADTFAAENSSVFVQATFYDTSQQGSRLAIVQRSQDITGSAVVSFFADDYGSTFDDDQDGLSNADEITGGSNPKDSNSPAREPCDISQFTVGCDIDTDSDDKPDSQETASTDSDGDGIPNYLESSKVDDDGDGRPAEADIDDENACIPTVNVAACQVTLDGDGDGRPNGEDNCPADANSDQADADGDGIGDICDPTPGTADVTLPTWIAGTVSVSNQTPTTLDVNWSGATDDTAVASYIVRFTAAGSTITSSQTSTTTSVTLENLTEETSYTITVEALDAAGNESTTGPSVTGSTTAIPIVADTTSPTWTPVGTVSVTNATPTSLDISWSGVATDDTAVTAYIVTYEGGGTTASVTVTTAEPVTLSGLADETTYTITVRAQDAAGNTSTTNPTGSGATTAIPVVADTTSPTWAPVGSVSVSNETSTSLDVSWSGVATDDTAVTGYIVTYTGGGITESVTSAAPPVTLSGLTADTTYTITVRARDAAGNTSTTNPTGSGDTAAPPVVEDTTAPSWTGGGSVSVTNETPTSLVVSWSGATDDTAVTSYNVSYGDGIAAPSVATSATTSITLTGLTGSTDYTIEVQALDAAANVSTTGPSIVGTTIAAPDTVAPTWTGGGSISVTNETATSLVVSWSGATDDTAVIGYEVTYQDGVAAPVLVTSTTTTITLTGLTDATDYSIEVQAVDAAANISITGPSVVGTTTAAADTTAPIWPATAVVTVSNETSESLDLDWSDATDDTAVASYSVSYSDGITAPSAATSSMTSITLTGLIASTDYTITIEAEDAAGNLSTTGPSVVGSTIAAVDTEEPTWLASATISVTDELPTSLVVSWSGATDDTAVTGYEVTYGDGVSTPEVVTSTTTTVTLTGLTPLTDYTISVEAVDAAMNTSNDGPSVVGSTTSLILVDTEAPTWNVATIISVTNETATTLDLSWSGATDNTAVTGYLVSYSEGAFPANSVTSATESVTLTGLTSATNYTIIVEALDAAANISTDGPSVVGGTT